MELIHHSWYSYSTLLEILLFGLQIFLYLFALYFSLLFLISFVFLPRLLTNQLKNERLKINKKTFSLNS
jgi:hypothetical protein